MNSTEPNPYAAPAPVTDAAPRPLPYVGSVLRQGWRVFAGHWGTLAALVAIIWTPVAIVTSYLLYEVIDETSPLQVLLIPVDFLTEALATGALIAVAIAAGKGRHPTVQEAMRTSLSVWARFAWTYFLCTLLIVVGMLAFILPGLYLAVRLSLSDSVVLNEGEWGTSAIRRSFELTSGRFWPLAVLCGLLILLSIVAWSSSSIVMEFVPAINTWQMEVVMSLTINWIEAYPAICLYLFYRRTLPPESRAVTPSMGV